VDLLDLKQKQANVSEARSGRFQAEQATRQAVETAKQGTSIMLVSLPPSTKLFSNLNSIAVHHCNNSICEYFLVLSNAADDI